MPSCIFCHHIPKSAILYESPAFKVVFDIDPIQTGHLLIISKQHYNSITDLPKDQLYDLIELQQCLVQLLEQSLTIDGVTIASNDKNLMDAGTHFHVHLIPRIKDDGFWEHITLEQLTLPMDKLLQGLSKIT